MIVGAGSAGCVLANRLSEDPAVRVLVVEAGGRDWSPYIHVPAGFMNLLDHPTLTWGYHAEPDPGTAGRAILYPRGRVLGGSSSINGLIYVRGQPEDFDHWARGFILRKVFYSVPCGAQQDREWEAAPFGRGPCARSC